MRRWQATFSRFGQGLTHTRLPRGQQGRQSVPFSSNRQPLERLNEGSVMPCLYRRPPLRASFTGGTAYPLRGAPERLAFSPPDLAPARFPVSDRRISLIGLPTRPNRSRIFFSRYRRYEKCRSPTSFTNITIVGASEPAWVAYPTFSRRPLTLGGGCSSTASRSSRLRSLGGILMRRCPTTSRAAGRMAPIPSFVRADTATTGANGANLKSLASVARQYAALRC